MSLSDEMLDAPPVTRQEAREIAHRYHNLQFNNVGDRPRASIPARFDYDDDLRLHLFIEQPTLHDCDGKEHVCRVERAPDGKVFVKLGRVNDRVPDVVLSFDDWHTAQAVCLAITGRLNPITEVISNEARARSETASTLLDALDEIANGVEDAGAVARRALAKAAGNDS